MAVPHGGVDGGHLRRTALHALGLRDLPAHRLRGRDRLVLAEQIRTGSAGMIQRKVIDAAALPDHAFGSRSIMWWSTATIIAVEATVFLLTIASYFYLQGNEEAWPPPGTPYPGYFWGTVNVAILLASIYPNIKVKNAAEEMDIPTVRRWMVIADLFAIAFVVVRVFEFKQLNVSWDSNAYGSATWTLLGLHTVHLLTDLVDSVVLTALMF